MFDTKLLIAFPPTPPRPQENVIPLSMKGPLINRSCNIHHIQTTLYNFPSWWHFDPVGVRSSQIPLFFVSFQCFCCWKLTQNKSILWENISQEQPNRTPHFKLAALKSLSESESRSVVFFTLSLRDGCTTPQHEELPRCIAPLALQTLGPWNGRAFIPSMGWIWYISKNNGTPKSSILIGFSIINHPFWSTPHSWKHPYVPKSITHGIRDLYGTRHLKKWDKRPLEWDHRRL